MEFRKADVSEKGKILSLYRSVLGSEFTTWDEEYPNIKTIEWDLSAGSLYVMAEVDEIIGAISIVPENELDWVPYWKVREGAREIARFVVAAAYRGRGIAQKMLAETERILAHGGCRAVHLLVACKNIPAYRTYVKAGYTMLGKCEAYGGIYYACEKDLKIPEKHRISNNNRCIFNAE